ncbi:MAG: (d)CMP kinase [Rikenellaceae bacterium]
MEQSNNLKPIIIAIDGFSSCGKSTFAKSIAARLGYVFIDTGAMYRAVALAAIRGGYVGDEAIDREGVISILPQIEIGFRYNPTRGASDIYIGEELVEDQIRTIEVSQTVSRISSIAEVREKLVSLQQSMGESGGIVMDGRDIGTVVFPTAQIKLYMTADPKIRAQRRFDELSAKGDAVSFEEIEENIISRDNADISREVSPLRQAHDAIVLDNSHMSVEEQMEWFMDIFEQRTSKK